MNHFSLLLAAMLLEALCGYPRWLFARIGHPVVWIGAGIACLERNFNRPRATRLTGALSMALLLALTLTVALFIHHTHWIIELLAISSLLAQRSLYDHVQAVARAPNIEEARIALGRIVGRDVQSLDAEGIRRAAIESLAESFCDGVVAPIFWAACFGLPGIACYKAINTADSMIGHKDTRYLHYGWAAARLDDLANYLPARISGLLLVLASRSKNAWRIMKRDARNHASPNAGWPEAAMAGALHLQLGGGNFYDGVLHEAPTLGDGMRNATPEHLQQALSLYLTACAIIALALLVPIIFR